MHGRIMAICWCASLLLLSQCVSARFIGASHDEIVARGDGATGTVNAEGRKLKGKFLQITGK